MAGLEPGHRIHTRAYLVDAVVVDDAHFRLDGRVTDTKPDGLWGVDDPNPLNVHDMTLSMTIDVRSLTVTAVETNMHTHPEHECPLVLASYQQLVGLSIMRGFTHKVREMFGGPKACTHIGALINAMAPVAMQSRWAFMHAMSLDATPSDAPVISRRDLLERQRNTCHVWATDGPRFSMIDAGIEPGPDEPRRIPLWAEKRLAELGVDPASWSVEND